MKEWWQWSPAQGSERLGFAIIGVGRFGIAVCRELLQNGADVLAVDRSERAVDELRQVEPSVEARVVDCTDEEALREAGVLDMGTVVVAISEPIEASITATLIAKDSEGSRVRQVIARATSDLHEKMLKRVGADGARGASWQMLQAPLLAHLRQRPVIHDFRAADLALGGQGAPLVPRADAALLGRTQGWRALLNLSLIHI